MTPSMRRLGWLALPLLLAASVSCGDDGSTGTGGTGGGGGTAGTGGTAGSVGTGGGASVTISGQLLSFPNQPVEGGDVCFVSAGATDLCTPTGVEGGYSLAGVPANTVGALRFRGTGIVTLYLMIVTQSDDLEIPMAVETPALVEQYYSQAGVTAGADGVLLQAQITPPVAGAVPVLTPASGQGPYFWLDDTATLDLSATATTQIGVGIFLDLEPSGGPFSLHFALDGQICDTPLFGGDLPPWEIPADADEVFIPFDCP
jgi:hypothetical protein